MAQEILKFIHNLNKAKLNLEVFLLGDVNDRAKRKFSQYVKKIDFIITDLKTEPAVSQELREAIDLEYKSDAYCVEAIMEKVLMLTPDERDILENIVDAVIKGEEINIVYDDKTKKNEKENVTEATQ